MSGTLCGVLAVPLWKWRPKEGGTHFQKWQENVLYFFFEDMLQFLKQDLPNIIMLVLKRFYFTLNESEIETLMASAIQAAKILENSLLIVANPQIANNIKNMIKTKNSLDEVELEITPDSSVGSNANSYPPLSRAENTDVDNTSSDDLSRIGLKTKKNTFLASELNAKAKLELKCVGNKRILSTNNLSLENDDVYVPTNLTSTLNSLQFRQISALLAHNYRTLVKIKKASVQALEHSKVGDLIFHQKNQSTKMNVMEQNKLRNSSWFLNSATPDDKKANMIDVHKIAQAVKNFSEEQKILDIMNQPFDLSTYKVYAVCRTMDDVDFYMKLPNVWRNFGYNNLNRLLDLAFELTLMAYADVINTNHSLIHALNKFVNGNDRVGNVEMDLLFGTVLGEYRTPPNQRNKFVPEDDIIATEDVSKTDLLSPEITPEALDGGGEWCSRMFLPQTTSLSNDNAKNTLVSNILSRAHDKVAELLCTIVKRGHK